MEQTIVKNEIEGNKLIAAFMGADFQDPNLIYYKEWIDHHRYFKADELKYHTSWNWLMPVIEKISRIEYERWEDELPFGGTQTVIDTAYPRTFGMLDREGKPMFRFNRCSLFTADTLIEAAWLAVVEFLQADAS